MSRADRGDVHRLMRVFPARPSTSLRAGFSRKLLHVKKNAAHWENDIDGPKDYRMFVKRMKE